MEEIEHELVMLKGNAEYHQSTSPEDKTIGVEKQPRQTMTKDDRNHVPKTQ